MVKGISNFDIVQADQYLGLPAQGSGSTDEANTGAVFYVNNSSSGLLTGAIAGSNGNDGKSPLTPFATIDFAIGQCTASRGDTIYVMPGHAETVSTAGGIAQDVAGVEIIGVGVGHSRPVITFDTITGASWAVSANNCKVKNIVGLAGLDGLTLPFNVTGNNCVIDIEWQDASSLIEAETVVRLDTADNATLYLKYNGFTAGNAAVRVVAIDDCDNVQIYIDAYGVVSTAWVNMVDVASTNVSVRGRLFTQGITNFTRDVVDTVTGSTWDADIFDSSFGGRVSGGSAQALASDDAGAIDAKIGTITNTGGTATIGAILGDFANTTLISKLNVPTADAVGNVDVGDVVGNKTDAAIADTIEGGAATTQSIVADVKAVLQRIGADSANNTAATTLVAANEDGSILERLERIQQDTGRGTGTALATNESLADVLYAANGIATYPSAAAPANNVSIAEVLREVYDQADKSVTNTAATLVTGTTVFTVAGGSIEILALEAVCVTGNDATASTLQWSCDGTDGAATTFSGASASLANAAAGASVVLQGTTLATAAVLNASGAGIGQQVTNGIRIPAGIITTTVGVGSTTGTWQHRIRYRPLGRGVTVT